MRGRGRGAIRRASGVKLASIFFGSVFIIFCRNLGRELNVSSKVLEELSRSWVGVLALVCHILEYTKER